MREARIAGLVLALMFPALPMPGEVLPEDRHRRIEANVAFVVHHELAHVLIDRMALPLPGREEDAADSLGVILTERFRNESEAAAIMLAAAATFAGLADGADAGAAAFQAAHALDRQRQFNILCLHYGAAPAARVPVADAGGLPAARRASCPAETARAHAFWAPALARLRPGDGRRIWLRLRVIEAPVAPGQRVLLRALRDELRAVNRKFDPGFRLIVTFARCGEANAYYDPEEGTVTFCAELVRLFGR